MTGSALAKQFFIAADRNPRGAPRIWRKAALVFHGLSQDPRNSKMRKPLEDASLDFAGQAMRPVALNDFRNLLKNVSVAYQEAQKSPNEPPPWEDPIETESRRLQIENEETGAVPVSLAPPSLGGASLGRQARVMFNPSNDQVRQGIVAATTIAFWQGRGKRESRAFSVDLSVHSLPGELQTPSAIAVNPVSVRLFALVEYGADGDHATAVLDIGLGRRITVPGSYFAVVVGADPPLAGSSTIPVLVGSTICLFAAPSQTPPIRTVYVDALPAGASTGFLQIPFKAGLLMPILTSAATGATAIINFFGYGGGVAPRFQVLFQQTAQSMQNNPIPLGGEVAYVSVTNTGNANIDLALPFQLCL